MHPVTEIFIGKSEICDRILRALPKWFGIEEAIVSYAREVETMPLLAVIGEDGQASAFVALNFHNEHNAEIHVMGVMPACHGRGFGTALVREAELYARRSGRRFLTVKTLSPSRPNAEYDQTRRFYESVGFVALEEFKTLWGEHNPCLLMIKSI